MTWLSRAGRRVRALWVPSRVRQAYRVARLARRRVAAWRAVAADRHRAWAAERGRAEAADHLVNRMREVLDGLCDGKRARLAYMVGGDGWLERGRQLVHEVDTDRVSVVRCYMKPAYADARPPVREFYTEHLSLVRFAVDLTLTIDTPPEVVADAVAERVRAAVMARWADQSVVG